MFGSGRCRASAATLASAVLLAAVASIAPGSTASATSVVPAQGPISSVALWGGGPVPRAALDPELSTSTRVRASAVPPQSPGRDQAGAQEEAPDPPLSPILYPSFNGPGSDDGWDESSSGGFSTVTDEYFLLTGVKGIDGSENSADLCGYPGGCDPDEVYQSFTVPDGVTQAILTFDVAAACNQPAGETCDTGPNYPVTVGLMDGNDNTAGDSFTFEVTNPSTGGIYVSPMSSESVNVTSFLQGRPLQTIKAIAYDAAAPGDLTEWFVDNVVLSVSALASPPTNIIATSTASGQASVSWTAPSDAIPDDVTGYTVTTDNDQGVAVGTPESVSGTSTTITGLTDGTPWYFSVASVSPIGTGPAAESNSVTPLSGAAPGAALTAVSQSQYLLPNSDGTTWQVMDASKLAFTIDPSSTENVLLGANADLWTFNSGYNQDLGIQVTPGSGTPVLAAWKESGGFAGTFSPNAAFVETVYPMNAGTTYTVQIVWKTNTAAIGATIAAGAGPIGSSFSPTRLTADVLPAGYQSVVSTQQYTSINSNGSTWVELDGAHLVTTAFSPSSAESVVVSGNADLWTANAGYNQDLGIFVSVNGATPVLVAWKESGGFAGTFSPNAAFVQAVYPMTAGDSYVFSLWWKANTRAIGTIFVGAGSSPTFSPTRLTVYPLPADSAPDQWATAPSNTQYSLPNSNGSTWVEMDPTNLAPTAIAIGSGGAAETVLVSGNADLWTANSGYNQDLGIEVSVNGGTPALVAWKESGGFAGTYSPNAAFVQAVYTMNPGNSYVFSLWWKTNHSAPGATIYAGAGPINSAYSPTRLTVVPQL